MKVRFCTVSRGWSWFWQWSVVHTWFGSQVFMYRMRRLLSAAERHQPPPSMTISGPVSLKTLAVLVEGDGDRIRAAVEGDDAALRHGVDESALEVQLAGVPLPTTVVGFDTSSRPAPGGMTQGATMSDQVSSCPASKSSEKIDSPEAAPRFKVDRSISTATFFIEAPPFQGYLDNSKGQSGS